MNRLRVWWMVCCWLVSGTALAAPGPAEVVRDALANTGVANSFSNISEMVRDGLAQRRSEALDDGAKVDDYDQMNAVMLKAYDAKRIEQRVVDVLVKVYDPNRFQMLNSAHSNDLAKHMRKMKQAVADKDNAHKAQALIAKLPKLDPARETLLKELDSASAESELSAGVQAMVSAALLDAMAERKLVPNEAKAMRYNSKLELFYSQMLEPTNKTVLKLNQYAYREATDDQLRQYARLYRGKPTQWFIQQSIDALMEVMQQVDTEVIAELGGKAKK